MRVAILGAGGIGLASAACLITKGHQATLWSSSGRGLLHIAAEGLRTKGAQEVHVYPGTEGSLEVVVERADVVLVAIPAHGRRALFDRLRPMLKARQTVIISAELSLGAQYLSNGANPETSIVAWPTTALTGKRLGNGLAEIGSMRTAVPAAVLPSSAADLALAVCRSLFGDIFHAVSPLEVLLNNLNPQVHLANVLCNWTRVEKGELWFNYDGITPAVARLIEDMDKERLELAASYGAQVRSVTQHFALSFGLDLQRTLHAMATELHHRRGGPPGPTALSTRFIVEDVPFGIVPLVRLGAAKAIDMHLYNAGLRIVDSLCGTDHASQNDLLGAELLKQVLLGH